MLKFNKLLNLNVILGSVALVFFIQSAGYTINISTKHYLRKPLMATDDDAKRLGEASKNVAIGGKTLILYSGPSAVGKSPLWEQIKRYYHSYFSRIILYTSRPARRGEQDGVDFHFRSVEEIQQMAQRNPEHFVTLEVNTDLQGLDMRDVERAMQSGQVGIAEVSVDWAVKLRERYPAQVFTIFIAPLSDEEQQRRVAVQGISVDEVIEQEMLKRQNERDIEKPTPKPKREARAKGAIREMGMRTRYDALIVSPHLRDIAAHQERWDGEEGAALVKQFMQYVEAATLKKPIADFLSPQTPALKGAIRVPSAAETGL